MNLFEIDQNLRNICENINDFAQDNDGLIDECLLDNLEHMEYEKKEKIDAICWIIKESKSNIESIDNILDDLKSKQEALENKVINLKKLLNLSLRGEKFKTPTNNIYYTETEKVQINCDAEMLPHEYLVIEYKPIKHAINQAIKSGLKIDGCELIKTKNMVIR